MTDLPLLQLYELQQNTQNNNSTNSQDTGNAWNFRDKSCTAYSFDHRLNISIFSFCIIFSFRGTTMIV